MASPDFITASRHSSTRFSVITSQDHAGYVWICTILATIYIIFSSLLRAFVKWRMYGWDDLLHGFATAVYMAQATTVFVGLENGLAAMNDTVDKNEIIQSSKVRPNTIIPLTP